MFARAQTAVLLQRWHAGLKDEQHSWWELMEWLIRILMNSGAPSLCLHVWESISATDINAPPTGPFSVHYRVNSRLNDLSEVTFVFWRPYCIACTVNPTFLTGLNWPSTFLDCLFSSLLVKQHNSVSLSLSARVLITCSNSNATSRLMAQRQMQSGKMCWGRIKEGHPDCWFHCDADLRMAGCVRGTRVDSVCEDWLNKATDEAIVSVGTWCACLTGMWWLPVIGCLCGKLLARDITSCGVWHIMSHLIESWDCAVDRNIIRISRCCYISKLFYSWPDISARYKL